MYQRVRSFKNLPNLNGWPICELEILWSCVTKDRTENELHQLINIGSCGFHIHVAFKSGTEATNWNIKKVLQSAFQILHNSPARREDYESNRKQKVPTVLLCNKVCLLFTLKILCIDLFYAMLLLTFLEGQFRRRALYCTPSDHQQFKNVNKIALNRSVVSHRPLSLSFS